MLLIRRYSGQSIRIGEDIEICVLECGGSRVTIGINAPRDIPVKRVELLLTERQNAVAADSITPEALAGLSLKVDGTSVLSVISPRISFLDSDMNISGRQLRSRHGKTPANSNVDKG
jgi:carbon storage regulator